MKIYISGKIDDRLISSPAVGEFARAEEMLRAKGYEVFNPTDERWQRAILRDFKNELQLKDPWINGENQDFYAYRLLHNQMMLSLKDAVYFLSDWRQSPGATSEYWFARAVGKRMFFQDRSDACEYLIERMYREAKASGHPIEYTSMRDINDIEIAYFTKHLDEAWLPLAE